MCGLGLREGSIGRFLRRMNEIGKFERVLDENTGMLLPTRSQLPSWVYNLTAKPRTSRARSAEPLLPATVENRTNAGVFSPGRCRRSARVMSAND